MSSCLWQFSSLEASAAITARLSISCMMSSPILFSSSSNVICRLLDQLCNHIRIGACVHRRYATRALIGKKKLADSNYGGKNTDAVCYRDGNGKSGCARFG